MFYLDYCNNASELSGTIYYLSQKKLNNLQGEIMKVITSSYGGCFKHNKTKLQAITA